MKHSNGPRKVYWKNGNTGTEEIQREKGICFTEADRIQVIDLSD